MDLKSKKEEIVSLSNERDRLWSDLQRLIIKKQEAEKTMEELENKCRSLGFDPKTLDQVIASLEEECDSKVLAYNTSLQRLSQQIKELQKVVI